MMEYADNTLVEPKFPQELLAEVKKAHDEEAERESVASQDKLFAVFIVAHERKMVAAESEFIIEGVYSALERANNKIMETFNNHYPENPASSLYAQGVWESIGSNSVGWYVSRNGTLLLEVEDDEANKCRVYAERHEVE
ncbi:hypothetical protein N7478_005664 [Penicillium angulare]|uniref:uncharacterized protein n=1 Tax=Penicillium angulare TaxID=116970 RepID=UPI00254160E3|nr:uncharacterized protein N7478_005664 [Penicillium angulare]KAJ5280292.1 hypothetical protein N7478_005664 [Penicillium angulare]